MCCQSSLKNHALRHGGTAINLFVRDMSRLSVDIDLTYVEITEHNETLESINLALVRIQERIESLRRARLRRAELFRMDELEDTMTKEGELSPQQTRKNNADNEPSESQ